MDGTAPYAGGIRAPAAIRRLSRSPRLRFQSLNGRVGSAPTGGPSRAAVPARVRPFQNREPDWGPPATVAAPRVSPRGSLGEEGALKWGGVSRCKPDLEAGNQGPDWKSARKQHHVPGLDVFPCGRGALGSDP